MARLKQSGQEVGLREYLLEWKVEFRAHYGTKLPGSWEELSKPIDRLVGGESYDFPRYMLPEGHPQSAPRGGDPGDRLVLTDDDVLVDYDKFHAIRCP